MDKVPLSLMMAFRRAQDLSMKELLVCPNRVVEVFYPDMQNWYKGHVVSTSCGNSTFTIKFEDGEESRFYYAGRHKVTWRHVLKKSQEEGEEVGQNNVAEEKRRDAHESRERKHRNGDAGDSETEFDFEKSGRNEENGKDNEIYNNEGIKQSESRRRVVKKREKKRMTSTAIGGEETIDLPPKPKRPLTSYFFYCKAMRPEIKKVHPEYGPNDLVSFIGKQWRALSAEEKRPFEVQSAADKLRYERESSAYEALVLERGLVAPKKKKKKTRRIAKPKTNTNNGRKMSSKSTIDAEDYYDESADASDMQPSDLELFLCSDGRWGVRLHADENGRGKTRDLGRYKKRSDAIDAWRLFLQAQQRAARLKREKNRKELIREAAKEDSRAQEILAASRGGTGGSRKRTSTAKTSTQNALDASTTTSSSKRRRVQAHSKSTASSSSSSSPPPLAAAVATTKRNEEEKRNQNSAGTSKTYGQGRCVLKNERHLLKKWDNGHNDLCEVCGYGGDVLCCDYCNIVYHKECLRPPLQKIPDGDWACPACARQLDKLKTRWTNVEETIKENERMKREIDKLMKKKAAREEKRRKKIMKKKKKKKKKEEELSGDASYSNNVASGESRNSGRTETTSSSFAPPTVDRSAAPSFAPPASAQSRLRDPVMIWTHEQAEKWLETEWILDTVGTNTAGRASTRALPTPQMGIPTAPLMLPTAIPTTPLTLPTAIPTAPLMLPNGGFPMMTPAMMPGMPYFPHMGTNPAVATAAAAAAAMSHTAVPPSSTRRPNDPRRRR